MKECIFVNLNLKPVTKLLNLKGFVAAILFLATGMTYAQSPSIPKGRAPWETLRNPDLSSFKEVSGFTDPPAFSVRASAEWEEIDALMVTWTDYISIVRDIVSYAREECKVYIVCADSEAVKSDLTSHAVPLSNIYYLQTPYNSIWIRDYGPWNIYSNQVDSLNLIDWIYNRPTRPDDNEIPATIAEHDGLPVYQMILPPNDFVATGGNFMTDGWGTGFSSKLILNENNGTGLSLSAKSEEQIDSLMHDFMGINHYIKMETLPYDEIHHIDMHLKLLDEETLLVGQYPDGVADGPQIEANLNYILDNYTSVFGTPYKVVRMVMPPGATGNYPDEGGPYRTYTNCVFINKTVIVPTYAETYDTTAFRILRQNLPGYRIVGINCNSIINALGAIHCITKEVAASDPLLITHQPLHDTNNTIDDYMVNGWILHRSGINNATVYYTTDTTAAWQTAPMELTDSVSNTWSAAIPAQPLETTVYYYIHAESNSGKQQVRPITAPAGYWHFRVTDGLSGVQQSAFNAGTVKVYPVPASDNVFLSIQSNAFIDLQYDLFDLTGKQVMVSGNSSFQGNKLITLDLQSLASGAYILQYRINSEKGFVKIIKR